MQVVLQRQEQDPMKVKSLIPHSFIKRPKEKEATRDHCSKLATSTTGYSLTASQLVCSLNQNSSENTFPNRFGPCYTLKYVILGKRK